MYICAREDIQESTDIKDNQSIDLFIYRMVGTRQFWMCKATYASSLQMNGTIDFSVGKT